jgi:WD40 repeat protein
MLGQVAALCGGWPLLATLVGASVSGDVSAGATTQQALDIVSRALRAQGPQALDVWDTDQRKVAISHVISTTLRALDDSVRIPGVSDLSDRYLSLAVFPAVTPIPLEVLSRWWGAAHGWNSVAVRQFCKVLADRSLLSAYRADSDVVVLHDVFRAYLRGLVAHVLPDLHRSLLDSLRPPAGWADLPRSRAYEWAYLAYHLAESGNVQEMTDVLGDARYVIGKAAACGAHTLRADRDLVAAVRAATPGAEGTAGLDRAFQMTSLGYLLHGQHAEPDMAATLQVALAKDSIDDGGLAASVEQTGMALRWTLPAEDRSGTGHTGTIVSVAANGDLLVSGGEDGLVRFWDLSQRRLVRSLRGHTGWVHAVAISPDGATIASAGEDNIILLWSAADGTQVGMLAGHEKRIRALTFRRHATELISGAEDGLVRAWDLRTLTLARQASTRGVGIWSVSLSDDETMVAASGEDEYVRLFDLTTGDLLDEAALHRGWVRSARFLPGSHRLVSAASDGTARTWDARARHLEPRSVLDAAGERLRAVTYHDRRIVTAGEDATVRTHEDGRHLVASDTNGHVRMWSLPDGTQQWDQEAKAGRVRSLSVSAETNIVAAAGGDGVVRTWDLSTGDERATVSVPGWARAVALDHQGSRIAVGGGTGDIYLYDDASVEPSVTLAGHRGRVLMLGFSIDDASLVSAAADGTVRRWSLDGRGGSAQVRVDASAQCASYDPSTGHAAVASAAGTLLLRVADPG